MSSSLRITQEENPATTERGPIRRPAGRLTRGCVTAFLQARQTGENYAIRQPWLNRLEGIEDLSWNHDLRVEEMA